MDWPSLELKTQEAKGFGVAAGIRNIFFHGNSDVGRSKVPL